MQPRQPTEAEKEELTEYLTTEHEYRYNWNPYDLEEAKQLVEEALIAVFDNLADKDKYTYSAKVMVVIYSTGDLPVA